VLRPHRHRLVSPFRRRRRNLLRGARFRPPRRHPPPPRRHERFGSRRQPPAPGFQERCRSRSRQPVRSRLYLPLLSGRSGLPLPHPLPQPFPTPQARAPSMIQPHRLPNPHAGHPPSRARDRGYPYPDLPHLRPRSRDYPRRPAHSEHDRRRQRRLVANRVLRGGQVRARTSRGWLCQQVGSVTPTIGARLRSRQYARLASKEKRTY
jgi:hypothetical protein